jgi:signal transduction histidine kinase
MTDWIKCSNIAGLVSGLAFCASAGLLCAGQATNQLVIQSVLVDGSALPLRSSGNLNVGPVPKRVFIRFGTSTNSQPPMRTRYKLQGFENEWHEGGGFMFMAVRFFNDSGDQIDQKIFQVSGESAGWSGSLTHSPLAHRRETLVVPPKAARAWVVISSAGPPATVGIYVVANLVVTGSAGNSPPTVLMPAPFEHQADENSDAIASGWTRDGTHPSMAKVVQIGQDPPIRALAIEDEDPTAHAEWHNDKELAPRVSPGEHLVVEWNEMFSIGVGDLNSVLYEKLPPGSYQFQVAGVDLMGRPTGVEAAMKILVPQPFWKRPWFWSALLVFATLALAGGGRYLIWHRMRREMLRLKNQQALEHERLRIAHDIHDDLGARVTQISLVSAMSQQDPALPEKARADFDRITQMSRDLISALYETVWAVNPEYDNLDALGNYLCQMVNQSCERTPFRGRIHVLDLPREVQVSSQTRHNITMVVKEAIHNVIKHAKASEVVIQVSFANGLLDITIQDNGCGFQSTGDHAGNGLTNMKQRMENIGGKCSIEGRPGQGTTVRVCLVIEGSESRPKK